MHPGDAHFPCHVCLPWKLHRHILLLSKTVSRRNIRSTLVRSCIFGWFRGRVEQHLKNMWVFKGHMLMRTTLVSESYLPYITLTSLPSGTKVSAQSLVMVLLHQCSPSVPFFPLSVTVVCLQHLSHKRPRSAKHTSFVTDFYVLCRDFSHNDIFWQPKSTSY